MDGDLMEILGSIFGSIITGIGSNLGSIITGIVTVVGVFLTNRLSYGRSTKEKFWDERRKAYSAILSELAEIDRITKGFDEWLATMGPEIAYESIDEGKVSVGKHLKVVWRKYSEDHLIMSDEFVRVFERFISEHDAGDPNDATNALHLERRKIITKYRALLLTQARKDLSG